MKLVLNTFLVIIILIMLCSCNNKTLTDTVERTVRSDNNIINENIISEKKTSDIKNVAMELISVDCTSANVKIYNNLEKDIDVEGVFEIQILMDDGWNDLPYIADIEGYIGHANPIESNSSLEFDIKWENYYGNLSTGHYRIKNYFLLADENDNYAFSEKYYLYSEFDVE